jgi:hypothetical protein
MLLPVTCCFHWHPQASGSGYWMLVLFASISSAGTTIDDCPYSRIQIYSGSSIRFMIYVNQTWRLCSSEVVAVNVIVEDSFIEFGIGGTVLMG